MERAKRLSDSVADNIISMIVVDKRFRPGDKLPNENVLSEELNVSRTTLREAIRILAAGNILEIKRGKGTYISRDFKAESMPGLSNISSAKIDARDLYEIRLIFEPETAYYATERATDTELKKILSLGKKIEKLIKDGQDYTAVEREFHKMMARATHNEFMNRLMPILYTAIDKGIVLSESGKIIAESTVADHKMLMQFMKNRNAEGAKNAMKIHILHTIEQLELE